MNNRIFLLFAIAILFALFVSSESLAANVVVKPSNMNGWVLASVSTGFGKFTERSPVGLPWMSKGNGSMYFSCGASGDNSYGVYPGQVWFGTNAYNGVLLSQITALSYYQWCTNSGIWNENKAGLPDQYSTPRQPIGLRLIVDPQNGTPIRMIYYRPRKTDAGFGYTVLPDDTDEVNYWNIQDCLNEDRTRFVEFINGGLVFGGWTWLKNRFPNGKIVQPALQVGGQWPEANPLNTPNACGISLQWGGEMYGTCDVPTVPYRNWWRESYNGISWVDQVTIGVKGVNTIYDFEADKTGRTVAITPNATQDLPVKRNSSNLQGYNTFTQGYVMYGRVDQVDSESFYLVDGRKKVWVRALWGDSMLKEGDMCSVYGIMLPCYSLQQPGQPIPMRLHSYVTSISVTKY